MLYTLILTKFKQVIQNLPEAEILVWKFCFFTKKKKKSIGGFISPRLLMRLSGILPVPNTSEFPDKRA